MVTFKLKRGNLVGLILAETPNGCLSLERSKLFCGKPSSSSGIIPNFYLGS